MGLSWSFSEQRSPDAQNLERVGLPQWLLAIDGAYAKLWAHQSGGFLDDTPGRAEVL
ncbi:hypothetical protein GCM10023080_033980 [Streptomyces pseudoechinosporeus]